MNRHHIRPRSRGGSSKPRNIVTLDQQFHSAWHAVVENLTVDEAQDFLAIVMQGGLSWTSKELHDLRQLIRNGLLTVER